MKIVVLRLREVFKICRFYGFGFAFWGAVWWLCFYVHTPLNLKISKYALKRKTQLLDRYVEAHYAEIIAKYHVNPPKVTPQPRPVIWLFWGQGEASMPPLVRACYEQLKHHNSGVVLVTCENLQNYIILPPALNSKVQRGEIAWANYSDIIRNKLLSTHGGLWLDATVWVARPIPFEQLRSMSIYTANDVVNLSSRDTYFWTSGRFNWSSWALWARGRGELLFSFVGDMLCALAEREPMWIDYVLQDYLIDYAIRHFSVVENDMRSITLSNPNRFELAKCMNQPFSVESYKRATHGDFLFKLSFRAKWNARTQGGELTLYGRILEGCI